MKKVRVLIVDDSSLFRNLLSKVLKTDLLIEVVGSAADAFEARELLVRTKPDIMTLDLEMPKMDGLDFLEKVMEHFPTKTVIITGTTSQGSMKALRSLELGALDLVEKPELKDAKALNEFSKTFCEKIRILAGANSFAAPIQRPRGMDPNQNKIFSQQLAKNVIAIASSTGGTEALKKVLTNLSPAIPAILIVQHMPKGFTKTFSQTLSSLVPFPVTEAINGEKVTEGRVYLAPGDYHMEVNKSGGVATIRLHQESPQHGVRPAADYLFTSVAKAFGPQAIGAVLTGMGRDGAKGLLDMKQAGSSTLVQSEKTCVVFGMPQACIANGSAQKILDLDKIGTALSRLAEDLKRAKAS